jgi:hypothetical protein
MTMEKVGFTTREMRDAEWRRLKAEGQKGVCKYTTHSFHEQTNNVTGEITRPYPILWIVAWSTPKPETVAQEKK